MRKSKKNAQKLFYSLYSSKIPILDDEGNPTFEYTNGYSEPVEFSDYVSPGKSDSTDSPFGTDLEYDRILLTYDMKIPIDEHSILWVGKQPVTNNGVTDFTSANYKVSAPPVYGLNAIQIAISLRKLDKWYFYHKTNKNVCMR